MPFEPIAIVAEACTLPEAHTPGELWSNVIAGKSCLSSVPSERWRIPRSLAMGSVSSSVDRTWTDVSGYVRGFDELFDPSGFGLPPEEILSLDPLFLWAMHGARDALR